MREFEVGSYGVSQWGYDQTNTDFYKVIKKTDKSVWLLPVWPEFVESTGSMSGYVIASDRPKESYNKVIMRRITRYQNNNEISEHSGGWYGSETVFPWNGQKMVTTWYA